MPDDQPIAHTTDGRPIYDNTPTVVSVMIQDRTKGVLAIRRANEPGKGLLGLPGGYHMRGETWRQAGAREVLEETSVVIDPSFIEPVSVETDEYGNNLIIAKLGIFQDVTPSPQDGEALEILWINWDSLNPSDWAFPRHYDAVFNAVALNQVAKEAG